MNSRKIICLVSGKSYTFSKDYYDKKVIEYGDEDSLKKYFITRKVKTYLNKGYSINDIRNIIGSTDESLPDQDSEDIRAMIEYHSIRNTGKSKRVSNTLNFATLKSDPDVSVFINTISQYEQ